ncbi:MAG: zf-HC2 domain-containing protein [Candidatus Latescibacterota bacterium]|jgi:anti-sigma factor RsiW
MFNKLIQKLTGGYTCERINRFLLDYVEGHLDQETARRFERHIRLCPNCARYLDQYQETIRMVKEIPQPDIPRELAERTRSFLGESLGKF